MKVDKVRNAGYAIVGTVAFKLHSTDLAYCEHGRSSDMVAAPIIKMTRLNASV